MVIAVPRHKLGQEQIEALRDEHRGTGLRFAIWRGREAEDPQDTQHRMCRRHEEATKVARIGLSVDKTLCRHGAMRCPYFDTCGYQRQNTTADIWLVAHQTLIHPKPTAIGPVRELMIDEDPLHALQVTDELEIDAFDRETQRGSDADVLTRESP